jgi:hypothetical protein
VSHTAGLYRKLPACAELAGEILGKLRRYVFDVDQVNSGSRWEAWRDGARVGQKVCEQTKSVMKVAGHMSQLQSHEMIELFSSGVKTPKLAQFMI